MIIRSLSRKTASFYQLYHYINGDDKIPYFVSWNLNIANHLDEERILNQFYQNSEHLKARKNGNVLYHEIVSIKRQPGVSLERQMKALHDLSLKYIQARGPNLMAYGRMHMDKKSLHMHVMYSANEVDQSKPFYLTSTEYGEIQKQCERYIRQTYPDLKQPVLYEKGRTQKPNKSRQREYEYTKRTGKKTKKQQVKEKLTELFAQERTQSLKGLLQQHGFELYQRGKHYGVRHGERKYRIETLGLLEEFAAAKMRRKTPVPEPGPTTFNEEKRAEKEEFQTSPQPEAQSTKTTNTGTTMDEILKGIQDAELQKRAELLEKLLNQKDLIKELFPDLEYTAERNGARVQIKAFGETMVIEFPRESLRNIPFGADNEEILLRREQIVKSAYETLLTELQNRNQEHDWKKVREDLEATKEMGSDGMEM